MDLKRPREDTLRLSEHAWEWFDRLEDAGPEERAQFAAWLGESPRHVEEFLLATSINREFEGMDPQRRIDLESMLLNQRSNVVAMPAKALEIPEQRTSGQGRRSWAALAAGIIGVAMAGTLVFASYPRWLGYSTGIGEQRTLELADGSIVNLNTRSRVKVSYSAAGRDLELISGEALFHVARDPDRPFRVRAGNAVIQALGTQFNVYRRSKDTSVAVLEGTVRVSSKDAAVVTVGQGASIAASGQITRRPAADTEKVSAWRQRRLVFRGEFLADVAAEFNRYNREPQIRVEDAAAANRKLTGVFDADDPELLLTFLHDDPQLRVERSARQILISSRFPEP